MNRGARRLVATVLALAGLVASAAAQPSDFDDFDVPPSPAPAAPAPAPTSPAPTAPAVPAAPAPVPSSPAPTAPTSPAPTAPTGPAPSPWAVNAQQAGETAAPPSGEVPDERPVRSAEARNVTADNPFGDPPPPPVDDRRTPPTPAQIEALRELEAELDRLRDRSAVYAGVVDSLLTREYHRQRRVRTRWFTQRIADERAAVIAARAHAIDVFESFLSRFPDDPTYSPDAMFRLGELYFERSQQRADDAALAIAAGTAGDDVSAEADYGPTIDVYRRLVERFPSYARIDTVLYLIGYCAYYSSADPNGRREARAAWLGITCANQFAYRPDAFDPGPDSTDPLDVAIRREAARIEAELAANPEGVVTVPVASTDGAAVRPDIGTPFSGCRPLEVVGDDGARGPSRHLDEAWLRVGDTYFEEEGTRNGRYGAWLSIDAYAPLVAARDGAFLEGALYKTAWAHFKVTHYAEAVRTFAALLDRIEAVSSQGGRLRAGAQLRPEALRFLALSVLYIDWEALDQVQDGRNTLTMPRLRRAVRDTAQWAAEAYFETGAILLEEQRYLDAIAIWEYALGRWPTHRRAPEVTEQVRQAIHQTGDLNRERLATEALGRFGEGSAWWNANQAHPAEQIRAQELASNALLEAALYHHERAQALRASCQGDERRDPGCHRNAREEYVAAVSAYREYLRQYPNDPAAYELHYSLADALYRIGDYASAAAEFEWVRDSNMDNEHLSRAGRGAVDAYRHLLEESVAAGRVVPRAEPPTLGPDGRVRQVPVPELILSLARARQTYIARVDEAHDGEGRRAIYEYDNALILYYYGYWNLARTRLARIFDERCTGPDANEMGRDAWTALRAIAVGSNDIEGVASLARELQERACTFSPNGEAVVASREFCAASEHRDLPQCLSLRDLTSLQYRDALMIFQRAQSSTGAEQRELFERAATLLVSAVDEHPEDTQAPIALELAAQALTATQRFDSAGRLYERIIAEVGARQPVDDAERTAFDIILANANFQLAENAKQLFDFERALQFYRQLADGSRFANVSDGRVQAFRRDAVTNAALLLQRLRRFADASAYFQRLVQTTDDPAVRRDAELEVASMAYESRDYVNAERLLREFIRRYAADPSASATVVEAYAKLSECVRQTARDADAEATSLAAVVSAFRASGQPVASPSAYFAARAAFTLADRETAQVLAVGIDLGQPEDREALIRRLADAVLQARQNLVDPYVVRMSAVEAYRVPEFFIAARVAQARAYERLAEATRAALRAVDYRALVVATFRRRFTQELEARNIRGAAFRRTLDTLMQRVEDEGTIDEAQFEFQSGIEAQFEEGLNQLVCDVVVRYVTAVRVAQAAHVDDASVQYALNRLQAYGDEQIGQCIDGERRRDATFQPYAPSEFRRATQRQGLERAGSYPVPSLVQEAR